MLNILDIYISGIRRIIFPELGLQGSSLTGNIPTMDRLVTVKPRRLLNIEPTCNFALPCRERTLVLANHKVLSIQFGSR